MTMIQRVAGAFGTVPKVLENKLGELKIERRSRTIETTELLESAEKSPEDLERLVT